MANQIRERERERVIHKPLERTGASWLCQEDSIITLNKLCTRYIDVEQPVDPMNPMSCN